MKNAPPTDILVYVALSEEFDEFVAEFGVPLQDFAVNSVTLTAYRANVDSYRVVVVPAGRMGNTCSAAIAAMLIAEFDPQTVVVLGIAGSLSKDLGLGDVFLPETVKDFLANSAAVTGKDDWDLELSGSDIPSDRHILNWFQNLKHTNTEEFLRWQARTRILSQQLVSGATREKLSEGGISFDDCAELKAGEDRKLASGPMVGKGQQFSDWLKKKADRKFVALEMESAGVYSACQLRRTPPKVVAIRGISDFADERKSKIEGIGGTSFRKLAACNATAALACALRAGVFSKITAPQPNVGAENYYRPLVEWIDTSFRLRNWNNYSDYLIRGMVPFFFEDAVTDLAAFVFRAIWPSSSPSLRNAVIALSEHCSSFLAFYMKHSRVSPFGNDLYLKDHFYDRFPYESWEKHMAAELFSLWSSTCIELLVNIVVALNLFAEEVRQSLNPEFHLTSGKFVLRDAQGVWRPSNLHETDHLPTEFSDSKKLLDGYARKETELEEYVKSMKT